MSAVRVLVLNQTYEPLHVTSTRRAVVLVLKGKAENIEQGHGVLRSARMCIPRPLVIRLHRYVRRPHRVEVSFSKRNVFRRDNYTCQYCGTEGPGLTLDHIVPRSQGGATSWENVVVACQGCNRRKGNRSVSASQLKLRRQPRKPRYFWYQLVTHAANRSQLETWKKYLPLRQWPVEQLA